MIPLLVIAIAYLMGGIPFGYVLVKMTTGADVRRAGSGNIGATNVLRTTGRAAGVATLLLDIGKGYLAVWLAGRLTAQSPLWMAAAALAVMAGHAVASFVGAFLCLTPVALAAALVVFVATVAWTRYISMGSIVAAATFPLAVWLIQRPFLPVILAAFLAGGFVIYRHSSNICRLRDGQEHAFHFGAPRK